MKSTPYMDLPVSSLRAEYLIGGTTSLPRTLRRLLLFVGVFSSFLPYLAIGFGHSSAIQLSQVTLISAGLLGLPLLRRRLSFAVYLLICPLILSLFVLNLNVSPGLSSLVGFKSSVDTAFSVASLMGAAAIVDIEDLILILRALTAAFLANAVYGVFQFIEFHRGVFPLLWMYRLNPSFLIFTTTSAQTYLQNSPRPFGFFSEPSAMAACIGPWLCMMLVVYFLVTRHGRVLPKFFKFLIFTSVISSALLLAVSQSGMAPFALGGLFLCILFFSVFREKSPVDELARAPYHPHKSVQSLSRKLILVLGVIGAIGIGELSSRYGANGGTINSSWSQRWESIVIGLHLLPTSISHLLFGVGPGQSSILIQSVAPEIIRFYGIIPIIAIWSVTINYIVEVGVIGAFSLIILIVLAFKRILNGSSLRFVGVVILGLWLVAASATTSYVTLTPIWMLFGVLLSWDAVTAIR